MICCCRCRTCPTCGGDGVIPDYWVWPLVRPRPFVPIVPRPVLPPPYRVSRGAARDRALAVS